MTINHSAKTRKAWFRFYEELNDFLPCPKRKKKFLHEFTGKVSVKDMIESMGVPHTEIDLILANGKSVGFDYTVKDRNTISVYPVFESFDISKVQKLRPKPLRNPKFVLDVHLGTLTNYMRMLGFDSLWENNFNDEQIVEISIKEKRTILTRDVGILKRTNVTRGYWVRNTDPQKQIFEVVNRFNLTGLIKEFTRCISCNGKLRRTPKKTVIESLPQKVKEIQEVFYKCEDCSKVYWRGTHYDTMKLLVEKIKRESGRS